MLHASQGLLNKECHIQVKVHRANLLRDLLHYSTAKLSAYAVHSTPYWCAQQLFLFSGLPSRLGPGKAPGEKAPGRQSCARH